MTHSDLSTHPHYEFTYKRKGDVVDARPIARRIKRAVDAYKASDHRTLLATFGYLEKAVYALTLAAGNQLVTNAPLDMQYLSAMQRLSDWWGGVLQCPVECDRSLTLAYLSTCVARELESLESALNAGESHDFAARVALQMEEPDQPELPELIGDILYDMQSEADVHVDHPLLVKPYVIAVLESLKDKAQTSVRFGHLKELVSGVTMRRLKQIQKIYSVAPVGLKKGNHNG